MDLCKNSNLCNVCKSIPIDKLPSEDEPALPHQPDLASLEKSAKTCCLCKVIFLAASELSAIIYNQRTAVGPTPQGWVKSQPVEGGIACLSPLTRIPIEPGKAYVTIFGPHMYSFMCLGDSEYTERLYANPRLVFQEKSKVRPWLFGNWYTLSKDPIRHQLLGLGVRLGIGPTLEDAEGNTADDLFLRGSSFRFRTDSSSPMKDIIPGRIRAYNPFSYMARDQVLQWVGQCNERHQCAPYDTPLPTRVLDLSEIPDSTTIRLVETDGQMGQYVTLSHCWGTSHRIETTKATIQSHRNEISISALPQTFRDAICCTRLLGIRYLWIDTLCIIQNDPQDWKIQASKMGGVYQNAYLTIAASSSVDDSRGFLCPEIRNLHPLDPSADTISHGRPEPEAAVPNMIMVEGYDKPAFVMRDKSISFDFDDGYGTSVLLLSPEWMPSSLKKDPITYQIGEFGMAFDPLSTEPLSSRGWTLQERLLSPRTLHYGRVQMYWECQQCFIAEDGSVFGPKCRTIPSLKELPEQDISNAFRVFNFKDGNSTEKSDLGRMAVSPSENFREIWTKLVEEYSTRKLTYDQDKLPALAGLAHTIAVRTGDTYLAGLWGSLIFEMLCWKVWFHHPNLCQRSSCPHTTHVSLLPGALSKSEVKFPASYRAPSWSWASLEARIEFEKPWKEVPIAKFVDFEVITAGDPYGRIKSGLIKIFAPLLELRPGPKNNENKEDYPFSTHAEIDLGGSSITGIVFFDVEPEFPCSALFLSEVTALVLKRHDLDNTYVRIGISSWYSSEPSSNRSSSLDNWTLVTVI